MARQRWWYAVTWLVLLGGGAAGAVLRHLIAGAVQRRSGSVFPVGIMVVNLLGAFALGLLVGVDLHGRSGALAQVALQAGLLGAFTTYSTWAVDSLRQLEQRELAAAALNLAGGLAAGVALVVLGRLLGGWLVS